MSKKHLQKYVDEFTYRFNTRAVDFALVFSDMVHNVASAGTLSYKTLKHGTR